MENIISFGISIYTSTQLYKKREQQQQQQLLMQQLQQMQQHPPLGDPMNSEGMMKMVENQRVSELPLEGFTFNSLLPLTGIDQIGTISGLQNPNLLTQNQFLLASQQQQAVNLKYHLLTSMQKMVSLSEIMDLRCNQIHKRVPLNNRISCNRLMLTIKQRLLKIFFILRSWSHTRKKQSYLLPFFIKWEVVS
ncbi:PREDICTED: uncharacterized protein LOC105966434 [Erythranthe guttata]|uniref:uncharacterized protein LOC105966434 n=1 Tax=Erythranthe guttata TaxID=4155 RepID=UPI00064D75EB|nr:PREDICTED: uncharacterized protein LOC105966434 [Erythranthe guttata]|eukprot:XP_012846440.1 PREDICTED: uncharacterized protein LOC105966434 [Erythranthe guttata]